METSIIYPTTQLFVGMQRPRSWIVYDASSKETKNGTSLNDCLHTGPSLNPLLFDILVRFRENKIALVGDIEKAFLNVAVDSEDRDSLRFLWVEDVRDSNLSVVAYRFCFWVKCLTLLVEWDDKTPSGYLCRSRP